MKRKTSTWLATAIALSFLGEIPLTNENFGEFTVSFDTPAAYARSSGGRSRGGSFQRRSSPSRSNSSTQDSNNSSNTSGSSLRGGSFKRHSSPSTSGSSTQDSSNSSDTSGSRTTSTPKNNQRNNNSSTTPSLNRTVEKRGESQTSPVPVPNNSSDRTTRESSVGDRSTTETRSQTPIPSSSQQQPTTHSRRNSHSSGGWFLPTLGISFLGVGALLVARKLLGSHTDTSEHSATTEEGIPAELSNDVVTVSKLQIALLANARHVQEELTATSNEADLETREGLANFLQQAALTLLQAPEYWSHARTHSQTFPNRSQAAQFFEQLSVEERSKFSQETFRNEEGEIQQRELEPDLEEDPGAYIVVTFLVGTEDDKPLFDEIHSPQDLETALKQIAATTPDYLLIFELLWSPQDPSDSLTYDELLTEYTEMLQIA